MADQNDTTRLIELLINRQDGQQAQMDRLAATSEQLTANLNGQQAQMDRLAATSEQLAASLAKTDEILLTFGKVQVQIIDRLDAMHTEQVRANGVFTRFMQKQEEFNSRQDDFNIIFLEELRGLKQDLIVPKKEIMALQAASEEHAERLRRLEDLMNGFRNAA